MARNSNKLETSGKKLHISCKYKDSYTCDFHERWRRDFLEKSHPLCRKKFVVQPLYINCVVILTVLLLLFPVFLRCDKQIGPRVWSCFIANLIKLSNRRKILAVRTQFKQLQKESLKKIQAGLIAQLVEHCTGIAEVMGSNPVQASIFFSGFLFATALVAY